MEPITEKDNQQLLKEWQQEARNQTLDTLPAFLQKLAAGYSHDYGTICHAVAAAACGAAWAMNASEQGGITGLQGGAVMWEFVRNWQCTGNECGLRILDYDKMLYPQYAPTFAGQHIEGHAWKRVKAVAKRKLAEHEAASEQYTVDYAQWVLAIADYKLRFPDYDAQPDYYHRLGMGNAAEWKAEEQKAACGFEFAPTEPCRPGLSHEVQLHMESIAAGRLPFGMQLSAD